MQLSQVFRKSAPTRGGRWGLGRRDCTHRDCICVRNGLPGWGGWIRTSAFQNRNSQDSQPGRRDSNLCISKSSITADLDHQLVASGCSVAVLHHSRCGSPQPASPSPTRPRRSLKNRAVPRGFVVELYAELDRRKAVVFIHQADALRASPYQYQAQRRLREQLAEWLVEATAQIRRNDGDGPSFG